MKIDEEDDGHLGHAIWLDSRQCPVLIYRRETICHQT